MIGIKSAVKKLINYYGKGFTVDKIEILTNNHWRKFISGWELPDKMRQEFDYLEGEDFDCNNFIKYGGQYYDLSNFLRIEGENHPLANWHGVNAMSYFDGLVIRLSPCGEAYQIGRYYS